MPRKTYRIVSRDRDPARSWDDTTVWRLVLEEPGATSSSAFNPYMGYGAGKGKSVPRWRLYVQGKDSPYPGTTTIEIDPCLLEPDRDGDA